LLTLIEILPNKIDLSVSYSDIVEKINDCAEYLSSNVLDIEMFFLPLCIHRKIS